MYANNCIRDFRESIKKKKNLFNNGWVAVKQIKHRPFYNAFIGCDTFKRFRLKDLIRPGFFLIFFINAHHIFFKYISSDLFVFIIF